MSEPIKLIPNSTITTGRIIPELGPKKTLTQSKQNQQSFHDVLRKEIENADLKFSSHALKRIQDRNITLSDRDITQIWQAVEKAEDKGIRESLVVMDELSLIVSIKNKTVITAIDKTSLKENVITNIDGAVFI